VAVSVETRQGLRLLGAGVVLGALGDLLLRATPLGLGVTLWVVAFVALLCAFARRVAWWVVVPLVVFAALVSWRDSPWLVSLDLWALVVALALGALRTETGRVAAAGVVDYVVGLVGAALGALIGTTFVLDEVDWSELPRGGRTRQAAAVLRGVLIAVPLLVVFGALFVAADAVFGNLLGGFVPGPHTLVHLGVILLWFWIGAGLLRQLLVPPRAEDAVEVEPPITVGTTELTVALALLNALFLAFVLVQFRAFVGGHAFVESHAHVTYSSYARQGFFELVAVSALVLPVLLAVDWLAERRSRRLRFLSATLVALLFAVMASAIERMLLYTDRYGLTELRVYTTGFMLWLAVVFAWFLATVLRGRRHRFAVGALVSGFAAILAVHVVNPDAWIARVDARRAHPDVVYLEGLSDDALPTLVHELPRMKPGPRRRLSLLLLDHRHPHGWRSWNLSRSRAASLRTRLERIAL
jgi:hypothetical protein